MSAQPLRLPAPCAILARSHSARERVHARAAGRAFDMRGWSCQLNHLAADVQRAKSLVLPAGELGWLGEAAHNELIAFIERYLSHEVEDDIRYRVEERLRDGWVKIANSLRQLDDITPPNVRARAHDICRREVSNELKRPRNRLRAWLDDDAGAVAESVAAPGVNWTPGSAECEGGRELLLGALGRASKDLPRPYNVWRLVRTGLTHETIAEQLGVTARTIRNHLESFQAFVVIDLLEGGLAEEDLIGLGLGIKRNAVKDLIRKGRKFQRQKKQERSRRNEQQ